MAYRSDIAVITALPEEFEEFRKAFRDFTSTDLVQVEDDPFVFKGRLPQKHKSFLVYAAHQPEPGIISASVLATRMIDRYAPRYLVMLGIAAGFQRPGVDYGDVLIAKYVSHYQEGKVFSGGVVKRNRIGYMLERELNMMLQDRKDRIMEWISDRRGRKFRSHLGVILTGSQVVDCGSRDGRCGHLSGRE
jgi:nucleoside phosphorylase